MAKAEEGGRVALLQSVSARFADKNAKPLTDKHKMYQVVTGKERLS